MANARFAPRSTKAEDARAIANYLATNELKALPARGVPQFIARRAKRYAQ